MVYTRPMKCCRMIEIMRGRHLTFVCNNIIVQMTREPNLIKMNTFMQQFKKYIVIYYDTL